jgi:hypothetical protein
MKHKNLVLKLLRKCLKSLEPYQLETGIADVLYQIESAIIIIEKSEVSK